MTTAGAWVGYEMWPNPLPPIGGQYEAARFLVPRAVSPILCAVALIFALLGQAFGSSARGLSASNSCTSHQVSIDDLSQGAALQKISAMDWRTAKLDCSKAMQAESDHWRVNYTYAQALVAESLDDLHPERFDSKGMAAAATYLSSKITTGNPEPYLLLAYISMSLRDRLLSAYEQKMGKSTKTPRLYSQEDIDRLDEIGARTAEHWLLISACLGGNRAFESLGKFYVKNAVEGTMSETQRAYFDSRPDDRELLNQVKQHDDGQAAEKMSDRYMSESKVISDSGEDSIGKSRPVSMAMHWRKIFLLANASGWATYAVNLSSDEGSKRRRKRAAGLAEEIGSKYSVNVCRPFLRGNELLGR